MPAAPLRVKGGVENICSHFFFFFYYKAGLLLTVASPCDIHPSVGYLSPTPRLVKKGRKGARFTEDLLCAKGSVFIKSALFRLQATELEWNWLWVKQKEMGCRNDLAISHVIKQKWNIQTTRRAGKQLEPVTQTPPELS